MNPAEVIIIAIRWAHLLAAAWLVGAACFCLAVLPARPAGPPRPALEEALERGLRETAEITLVVFLTTGVILTYDRLAGGASSLYLGLLAFKIGLAGLFFHGLFRIRQTGLAKARSSLPVLAGAGALILLLAVALRTIHEAGAGPAG